MNNQRLNVEAKDKPDGRGRRKNRLHSGHFAFMRAIVQGVDRKLAWERYLGEEGTPFKPAAVRATVDWVRADLVSAARRFGRPGTARLVLLDSSTVVDERIVQPSLEDFVSEHGLEGFSESEQIEYFEQHYGNTKRSASQTRRAGRRARIIAQQLEALQWLEKLVAQAPGTDDPVAHWFPLRLVGKLSDSRIHTIGQLAIRVSELGPTWYRSIRGIGRGKAAWIEDWLQRHHNELETSAALRPAFGSGMERARRYGLMAPLVRFFGDADSTLNTLLVESSMVRVDIARDIEVIKAWLDSRQPLGREANVGARSLGARSLTHTQRAYLKEAERLFLWSVIEKGKPLSALTAEDCTAYINFMLDPQPRESWCGDRCRSKNSAAWRPFEGPLSLAARTRSVAALRTLWTYMKAIDHVAENPWLSVRPLGPLPKIRPERRLGDSEWRIVEDELARLSRTSSNQRLALALRLMRITGLTLSEAVAAHTKHITVSSEGTNRANLVWRMKVAGKGGRERYVVLADNLIEELSEYLASRGLDPNPLDCGSEGAFLLGRATDVVTRAPFSPVAQQPIDVRAGIGAATLYDELKRFFWRCSEVAESRDATAAKKLRGASSGWLRNS